MCFFLYYIVTQNFYAVFPEVKMQFSNQIEHSDSNHCYAVVADETMILACKYGYMGENPVQLCWVKSKKVGKPTFLLFTLHPAIDIESAIASGNTSVVSR